MQLYDRGIRRRLAPMLSGDQRHIELAFSLMFSLPGTPMIWYGDEIGMGDDLTQPERESVRMPMQWSSKPSAGFSTAPPDRLVKPIVSEGPYSAQHVNVADQRRDPDSLLNWMERIIRTRKECPELGWGHTEILDVGEPSVLAHCASWQGGTILAVHNLASEARVVNLDVSKYQAEELTNLLGNRETHQLKDGTCELLLEGYGYRWFRVGEPYR
jgi:maltose alpha-D-glucosyltransferase/alpha-amylase